MSASAKRFFLALIAGLAPVFASAGIISYPGFGEPGPIYTQEQLDAAVGQAFTNGRVTGRQESAAECIGDPANCGCLDSISPCGIEVSSLLTGAQFGETEPNDHILGADPLVTSALYWGQSLSLSDLDWFYVITVEPNQLLTLNFTVPNRVLEDTTRLSQGWLISVRDSAGNTFAQFDTRFALDDPNTLDKNESREITYPVFLGQVGTYYVVVEPRIADAGGVPITEPLPADINLNDLSILYSPYNLAAFLEFSGMDALPPDVNFSDVEIEPNDQRFEATPLTSGVAMFGSLRITLNSVLVDRDNPFEGEYFQSEQDWYVYSSPGNEILTLSLCDSAPCQDGTWSIWVEDEGGNNLAFFNTQGMDTARIGVQEPGNYYFRVGFHRLNEAVCAVSQTYVTCDEELVCYTWQRSEDDPNQAELTESEICGPGTNEGDPTNKPDLPADSDRLGIPFWVRTCAGFSETEVCVAFSPIVQTAEHISAQYNFRLIGTGLPPTSTP